MGSFSSFIPPGASPCTLKFRAIRGSFLSSRGFHGGRHSLSWGLTTSFLAASWLYRYTCFCGSSGSPIRDSSLHAYGAIVADHLDLRLGARSLGLHQYSVTLSCVHRTGGSVVDLLRVHDLIP